MAKSTTWMVKMQRLTELGELGGLMVRLMTIVQDFGLANHAMGMWKAEEGKYKSRKTGAGRYFLRLQMSHMFEAFEIIEDEIEKNEDFKKAIEACDESTRQSYQKLLDFRKSDDFKLLMRIRHNIGFHYGPKVVVQSLERIGKRQAKRREEKKPFTEYMSLTLGDEALDWYFAPTEMVENDVVIHGIFALPEGEEPADLQAKTDEIVMRLHEVAYILADFAGHFVKAHVKG